MSPMPREAARPVTKKPVPSTVRGAATLMLVRAALGVVSTIVAFSTRHQLRKLLFQHNRTLTASQLNTAVDVGLTVAIIFGIAFLVFYVFLAFQILAGKSWARVVTWILAGLGVLGLLTVLAQPYPTGTRLLAVVVGLIDAAVIALLALPSSNSYFATPTAAPDSYSPRY
jgi:hypothetical protein